MAKKAKRRGRPPGSKNKKSIGKSVATMDIAQLRAHIDSVCKVFSPRRSVSSAPISRASFRNSEATSQRRLRRLSKP